MCTVHPQATEKNWFGDKKYRLADFFDAHWDKYVKSPAEYIRPEQHKAVNAMRVCRTAALGKDVYLCIECGEITEIYHSCKNRFCPTCSWQDTLRWAEKVKRNMLNIPHRHAVFTLPHQLIPLINRNKKVLLNVLMRTSADTLKDWMEHKYGIKAGIISVLHTFGEKKDNHMHTHMIVSWGGINQKTGHMEPIKGDYVNYSFLKNKFRCKFEDSLIELFDTGKLNHNYNNRIVFMQFLKRINQKNWIVHLEPAMENPVAVIRYIGRYSKRACLSEYKITSIEGEYLSFRYKNYKRLDINQKPIEEELKLHYRKFFPRLLQHVPLPYFKIVRYYGVYSNRWHVPNEYLYKDTIPAQTEAEDWGMLQKEKTGKNPKLCQECNSIKEYMYTIIKKRLPGIDVYQEIRFERKYFAYNRHAA
jgi:hypothetical protein